MFVASIYAHYQDIRLVHITCVALSGTLFTVRALLRINGSLLANQQALRVSSYIIDTTLLLAAILLTLILHQYPFVNGWLTAKVLLLVLYVALGMVTLKRARTTVGRSVALASALSVYGAIIAIAITHRLHG